MPQQNFKEIFSKLTHSPQCQNDVLQGNINMDDFPTGILYGHIFALKDQTGVSMQHEGVFSQIEKQLWHKLEKKLSLNPASITILEVLKTRSRISKTHFSTLTWAKCLPMVSLIRCQQMSHSYSKRNQKGFSSVFSIM